MGRRFGSLCSGIEAASVAFAPLGWTAAWLSEVDVAASQVLAERLGATAPIYPLDPEEEGLEEKERKRRLAAIKSAGRMQWGDRIQNYGDMTMIRSLIVTGEAEAPEIVVAGTPCQGFSLAGLRGGLNDSRSNLALEYIRIVDAVDRRRKFRGELPCVTLWENVPGVLSDKTNAFGCLLAGLAGEDVPLLPSGKKWSNAGVVLGPKRAVAWRTRDAQYSGLAQRRKRVFVVASAREGFDPGAVLLEFDGLRRDSAPRRASRENATYDLAPCLTGSGRGVERTGDSRGQDPLVAQAVVRSDLTKAYRLVSFGEYADDDVASTMMARDFKYVTDVVAHAFQPRIARNGRGDMGDVVSALTGKGDAAPCVAYSFPAELGSTGYASEGDLSQCLTATNTPAICFSCKDHGADATEELAPTLRAMNFDGSHVNGGGQLAVCVTGQVTHALTSEGFDASEDGTGRGNPIVPVRAFQSSQSGVRLGDVHATLDANNGPRRHNGVLYAVQDRGLVWAVRRLMPIECERLQGFPDGHTAMLPGGKEAADGPRYRQLGNSWAVPCVYWIGDRIERHLNGESLLPRATLRRRAIEELL